MKLRTPLTILLVAGVTVGAIWLFNKPAAAPEKVAQAPAPAAAPKAVFSPVPQVAAPLAPPVPKSEESPSTTAAEEASAPINSGDPHGDLNFCIDDITTMLQAGNITGLIDNYAPPQVLAQMPPEARAQMEQYMSDPKAQQQMQMIAQAFQSLKTVTPTMNDTGDKATYQIAPPPGMIPPGQMAQGASVPSTIPITFMKQDGRWYISDGPGGGL